MSALFVNPTFWLGAAVVALAAACAWLGRRRDRRADQLQRELTACRAEASDQEQRLEQAQRMEAVGILAGGIVNNLNNLLAVVLGNARLMSRHDNGNGARQDELDRILKASHMAGDLVQELSDFYRQADQTRKPTDLVPVVRDTVKLLRDILPSSVSIKEHLQPCGPVLATQAGVQQILMNLCSNGVQAMQRSGGALTISLHEDIVREPLRAAPAHLAAGSYVCMTVSDDGRGMDPATVDQVFEQGPRERDDKPAAGLGLRTVQRIVGDHQGATVVESAPGRGTSVRVYFPLIAWSVQASPVRRRRSETAAAETPAVLIPLPGVEAEERRAAEPRATVLLVDDEEMVAQVLARGLRRMGYRVVPHVDSRKALADFSQTPEVFDIVVTDQIMPHMSGVRLTRRIHELRPRIPVIICTGFRDSFNEHQAREAGVSDFLLKPASHRDLAAMIDRLVRREMEGRA